MRTRPFHAFGFLLSLPLLLVLAGRGEVIGVRSADGWCGASSWVNLAVNSGFETGDLTGWVSDGNGWRVTTEAQRSGAYKLVRDPSDPGGHNGQDRREAYVLQYVSVAGCQDLIDQQLAAVAAGFYCRRREDNEFAKVIVEYLNGSTVLATKESGYRCSSTDWDNIGEIGILPAGTDGVRLQIWFDNDGDIDIRADDAYVSIRFSPTPTFTPTITPTDTPTPTWTPTITPTDTPTPTWTPTITPTDTPTPTWTPTPTPTPTVTPTPFPSDALVLLSTADTYVSAAQPDDNFGSSRILPLRSGGVETVLARFDLSAIPANAEITQALMAFFTEARTNPQPLTGRLYGLRREWAENQATYLLARSGQPWQQPGAAGAEDREQNPIVVVGMAGEGWTPMDVTGAIRERRLDPSKDHGFLLEGLQGGLVAYNLAAREWYTEGERPRLIVRYQTHTPTPRLTPTATPSPTTSPSQTHTATPSSTPTRPATATPTFTATATPTPIITPTATSTLTPTPTSAVTATFTPTSSPSVHSLYLPWARVFRTPTPTATATLTPTPSITPTWTATPTSTLTPTPTIMPSRTATPTPTATAPPDTEPNNSVDEARGPLQSGQTYRFDLGFGGDQQDFFFIDLVAPHTIEIWVTQIPAGANYHLYLYDQQRTPIKDSANPGNQDEHILSEPMPPGRYYVRVYRVNGSGAYMLRTVYQD